MTTEQIRGSILLVEDEPNARRGLKALLEQEGFEVVAAADGQEALELLAGFGPDVVLTDVRMPKMSGLELLAELQRRGLNLRVIVLTMSDQPRHVAEALRRALAGVGTDLQAVRVDMAEAFAATYWVSAFMCLATLVVAAFLPRKHEESHMLDEEPGEAAPVLMH